MTKKSFQLSFQLNATSYIADVWHHRQLTEEEKNFYNIREQSFLVHLFCMQGFRSFELFIDEDAMSWVTNSEDLVTHQVIAMLGERIDAHFS